MHFKVYGGKGGKVLQVSDTDPLENIELLIISDREDRRMLEVLSGAVHLSVDLRCSASRPNQEGLSQVKWVQVKCTPVLAFLQYLPAQYMFALLSFAFDIYMAMQAW